MDFDKNRGLSEFPCKFDLECRYVDVQGIICKNFITTPKRCKNRFVLTFTIKGSYRKSYLIYCLSTRNYRRNHYKRCVGTKTVACLSIPNNTTYISLLWVVVYTLYEYKFLQSGDFFLFYQKPF